MRALLAVLALAGGGLFAYDAKAPLGYRDSGVTSSRDGIVVRDVSFLAPKLGRVRAYLVLPRGDGPFAAAVWLPGSNGSRDHMLEDARSVAKRGIAALLPDPAGPVLTCDARERPTFVNNVVLLRRSLDVLSSLPRIDRSRLGAVGFSYGAMVTATAAGAEPRLRAVVLDSGRAHHSTAARQYCGASAALERSLRAIDPVTWVGRTRAPVLVQNGTLDTGTPRAEALALAKAAHTTVRWYPALHPLNEKAFADRATFLAQRLRATRTTSSARWHGCVGGEGRHGFLRTSDGTRVAYAATGRGRTAVVLAHQGNGDLCTWWPFARRLAASGFRAVAFDFRGYGLSPDRGYPAALRKDLDLRAAVAEARALGARRILLAGASLGGTVALAEAARPGTTVEGVVSLSAPETYVRFDGKALARRSKVPILLVAARDDAAGQFATDARTLHAASAAADKRLVIVAGGEHGVPLLERPALWKLVLGWLRSH